MREGIVQSLDVKLKACVSGYLKITRRKLSCDFGSVLKAGRSLEGGENEY